MVCNDLGMLTSDSDYTFVYGKGSMWAAWVSDDDEFDDDEFDPTWLRDSP